MEIVTYVLLGVGILAAVDRIFGSRFQIGKEFERGIMMLGPIVLSMAGMLVIVPFIAYLLEGLASVFPSFMDFSVIPASLIANDMGGAPLALLLSKDPEIGYFSGIIIGSMMGCTVSFTIPYVLSVTDKKHHKNIIFGLLCGVVTIPVGCIVGGVIMGAPFLKMLVSMLPLVLFSMLIVFGILKFEALTMKIFIGVSWFLKGLITVGLVIGITEFLTGYRVLPYMCPLGECMETLLHISCIMVGAFPLLYILKLVIAKPLSILGGRLGINEVSAFGLLSTLGNSATTFGMFDEMDERGVVLNSAFSVSAAFVFVDHLAYTLAFYSSGVPAMIVGKLISGISAVALALLFLKKKKAGGNAEIKND